LLNLVYNNGIYYIYHPGNPDKKSHINQIDNFLWQTIKFTPLGTVKLKEGDIIRFGRIPFKVSRIFKTNKRTAIDLDEATPGKIQLPEKFPPKTGSLDQT